MNRVGDAIGRASRPVCAYLYDRAVLRANAAALRAVLPADALLCYAVKANGHPAVVQTLAEVCDGLEVASGGELELAAGARLIVFGGPGKTDAELAAAIAAGAIVNVESVHELRRLDRLADRPTTVLLRVNRTVHSALAGSHQMTGGPSQFGIDEADLDAAVAAAGPLRIAGFGLHAVSNNLDARAHAAFIADAVAWSVSTAARLGVRLELVNAGGGLGVDYTGGQRFDLDAFGRGLSGVAVPDGVRLVVEPGRFLAASAGWYAAEVLDVKRSQGRWFAVLRGGTHHFRLPAAWGYSHPFTVVPVDEWPYPFARPEVVDDAVDVAGELCTPRDVLARGQRVDRLRAGDVVVFGNAGAYGWDISHHEFLRHPYPEMILI
jgi:2-[(L-alanin-3-ylcarbamoyl)methyl]-2-hydroxybutanedioate decarboxylase